MKSFIAFSDLHSLFNPTFDYWKDFLVQLTHSYPNAFILCLGDMDTNSNQPYLEYQNRILFIRGNNDDNVLPSFQEIEFQKYGVSFLKRNIENTLCDFCTFQIEDCTFVALHGHKVQNQKYTHPSTTKEKNEYQKALNQFRKDMHADYLLYGHSHEYEYNTKLHLINPGCVNEILCVGQPMYLEIVVDQHKIQIIPHIVSK